MMRKLSYVLILLSCLLLIGLTDFFLAGFNKEILSKPSFWFSIIDAIIILGSGRWAYCKNMVGISTITEGSFEIRDPKFKAKLIIFYTASLTMLNCSDGGGLDKSKIGF